MGTKIDFRVAQIEFFPDIIPMRRNGVYGHVKEVRDFFCALAFPDQVNNLNLLRRKFFIQRLKIIQKWRQHAVEIAFQRLEIFFIALIKIRLLELIQVRRYQIIDIRVHLIFKILLLLLIVFHQNTQRDIGFFQAFGRVLQFFFGSLFP